MSRTWQHRVGNMHAEHVLQTPSLNGFIDQSDRTPSVRQFNDYILENDLDADETNNTTSPTLARLRSTPNRIVRKKQELLIQKHNSARQNADRLNVGGGVSMWPEMTDMRLTQQDFIEILLVCICLIFIMIVAYHKIHGAVLMQLLLYWKKVGTFSQTHLINTADGQEDFHNSLIHWHNEYHHLLDEVHQTFDVSRFPALYVLYVGGYSVGMGGLVYYLLDNMFARSRLSPRRIKNWICLLVAIGGWTLGLTYLLVVAYCLESAIEKTVHSLNELQADLVHTKLNLSTFSVVLSYWQTRCLPPTTPGTLYILGVVAVRDVIHYIQYYSLPILTVLITPVFKLCESLYTVYNVKSC